MTLTDLWRLFALCRRGWIYLSILNISFINTIISASTVFPSVVVYDVCTTDAQNCSYIIVHLAYTDTIWNILMQNCSLS